jgi:hypothetical protein
VGQRVDELHELAEADDAAAREVSDVRHAARREQVVRADGVEVDARHRDEVRARARDGVGEDLGGIAPVPIDEVLEPSLRDAARGDRQVRRPADRRRQPEGVEEPLHGLGRGLRVGPGARGADRPNGHAAPGT